MFNSPILFCFFVRKTALQVFEQIANAKPAKIYLHQDGGRNPEEQQLCQKLREQILSKINWECQIFTKFQEKNIGCTKSIRGAVFWMFESEESGIVLEDDCVPNDSFFKFCEENLERYKNVPQVMHIGGYASKKAEQYLKDYPFSYAFSGAMMCWGWASWKRAFEFTPNDFRWSIYKNIKKCFSSVLNRLYYLRVYKKQGTHTWDWDWDWDWSYSIMKRGGGVLFQKRIW